LESRGTTRRHHAVESENAAGAHPETLYEWHAHGGTSAGTHANTIIESVSGNPQLASGRRRQDREPPDSKRYGNLLGATDISSESEQSERSAADSLQHRPLKKITPAAGFDNLLILDSLSTATLIVLPDGQIDFMNISAEQLFGMSRKQAKGRTFFGLLPGLEDLSALVDRANSDNQSFGQNVTFSVPHQDRMNIQAACRVSPFRNGRTEQFIVEFFDATQWRQIDREKALLNQRGVSRRIIRQLAHEIRNPLGGLRGAAQLLARELQSPALQEYIDVIIGEADRLVDLTDSLLGPTRPPAAVPVNIHEILERVLLLIEGEAAPGIKVYRDYDPSLPKVIVDRDQIIQAMLNLARNAAQALGVEGSIVVRTRALTNVIIGTTLHRLAAGIEIEDTGPGIPEDIKDSIFYPLVTGRPSGTGLGLPLAQDLVSRNGGLIEYESAPGRTVFMVRLPFEASRS
jgi:two-component system nitrogen regulation sensor histidine kinase GlnL